jgi:hypothetical protein
MPSPAGRIVERARVSDDDITVIATAGGEPRKQSAREDDGSWLTMPRRCPGRLVRA